jgi:hypothetical protein
MPHPPPANCAASPSASPTSMRPNASIPAPGTSRPWPAPLTPSICAAPAASTTSCPCTAAPSRTCATSPSAWPPRPTWTPSPRARRRGRARAGRSAAARGTGRRHAVVIADPQGRILRFVHGDERHADAARSDAPSRITHVVFNSADVAVAQRFFEEALGFRLSDRTKIMAFMRCNSDHHSIALADADANT